MFKLEYIKPWFINTPEFQSMIKSNYNSPKTIDSIVENETKK